MNENEQGRTICHSARPQIVATKLAVLCVFSLTMLSACGHPATEDECREILRHSARVELEGQLGDNKELIKSEILALEESMQESMMKKCVGKRITEGALECIRAAKSPEGLDRCFK